MKKHFTVYRTSKAMWIESNLGILTGIIYDVKEQEKIIKEWNSKKLKYKLINRKPNYIILPMPAIDL